MTEGQITFNYQKAMGQASELKTIASSLSKLSNDSLSGNLSNISKLDAALVIFDAEVLILPFRVLPFFT